MISNRRVNCITAWATIALAMFGCVKIKNMNNKDLILNIEPQCQSIHDMTVTAQVKSVGTAWEVVVVFSRLNEQPPIGATEIQVQMLTLDDKALDILEAPKGLLPEFGGGLGTSVNAQYLFRKGTSPPVQLVIRYATEEVVFQLVLAQK